MDLVGAGVLVSWLCIVLKHVRLRMALRAQGIPYTRLPWHNGWTCKSMDWVVCTYMADIVPVYTSAAALFMCTLILLTNGFYVFTAGNWSASGFVSAYL